MRLFVGIALDETTRAACASLATRLERSGVDARFVEPENYHLTLLFLGNVEPTRIGEIEAAAQSVASRHASFAVTIDRIGAFPHERKPRVIYAGARDPGDTYCALATDVRTALLQLGYASEDDAVAHVTLARVPEEARRALPMLDVAPIALSIDALTLFESVPHENRTRYAVLGAWRLTGLQPSEA